MQQAYESDQIIKVESDSVDESETTGNVFKSMFLCKTQKEKGTLDDANDLAENSQIISSEKAQKNMMALPPHWTAIYQDMYFIFKSSC